jgi:hypothetical protein
VVRRTSPVRTIVWLVVSVGSRGDDVHADVPRRRNSTRLVEASSVAHRTVALVALVDAVIPLITGAVVSATWRPSPRRRLNGPVRALMG